MGRFSSLIVSFLLAICPALLQGATIHVPGDQPTIQAGIDASSPGDSVVVSPGTYSESGIDFLGKAIVVTGVDPQDPGIVAATVVDAGGAGRAFWFHSGEGPASTLAGLTMTGGNTNNGGGILCEGASPTIAWNLITGNLVTGNWPSFGRGGGICCVNSDALLEDNVISQNTSGVGGGIFCSGSAPTIEGNTIEGNSAVGSDTGTGVGGGIHANSSQPVIRNNVIRLNSASQSGGGIRLAYHVSSISGNVIWGNVAGFHGGGISLYTSTSTITNNTVSMNQALSGSGGIGMYNSSPTIVNTICWGDTPVEFADGTPTVSYSDIQGGWPGVGNLESDPLLFAPDGGDYRLLPGSPCVDAGNPEILDACAPPGLGAARSDMGALGGAENCGWPVQGTVSVVLTPVGSLSVPHGGSLDFEIFLSNYRDYPSVGDLWLSVLQPDSTEQLLPGTLLSYSNPLSGQILPFGALALGDQLRIPGVAVPGTYRLIGRVGRFPDTVSDEDSFGFEVAP